MHYSLIFIKMFSDAIGGGFHFQTTLHHGMLPFVAGLKSHIGSKEQQSKQYLRTLHTPQFTN